VVCNVMPAIAADLAPVRPHQLGFQSNVQKDDDTDEHPQTIKGSWSCGIYEKYYQSAIARAQKWYPDQSRIEMAARPSLFVTCRRRRRPQVDGSIRRSALTASCVPNFRTWSDSVVAAASFRTAAIGGGAAVRAFRLVLIHSKAIHSVILNGNCSARDSPDKLDRYRVARWCLDF
jgi:hypothetical protein